MHFSPPDALEAPSLTSSWRMTCQPPRAQHCRRSSLEPPRTGPAGRRPSLGGFPLVETKEAMAQCPTEALGCFWPGPPIIERPPKSWHQLFSVVHFGRGSLPPKTQRNGHRPPSAGRRSSRPPRLGSGDADGQVLHHRLPRKPTGSDPPSGWFGNEFDFLAPANHFFCGFACGFLTRFMAQIYLTLLRTSKTTQAPMTSLLNSGQGWVQNRFVRTAGCHAYEVNSEPGATLTSICSRSRNLPL